MGVMTGVKVRFCKDSGIPISVVQEPYFSDRLKLLNPYYDSVREWTQFNTELAKYRCDHDYLEDWDRARLLAIGKIHNSKGFKEFQEAKFSAKAPEFKRSVYCPEFVGKTLISFDLVQADYNALKYFNPSIFGSTETWEEWISQFTDNSFLIESKRLRRCVLSECCPAKIARLQQCLINHLLCKLEVTVESIGYAGNDEVVIDVTNLDERVQQRVMDSVEKFVVPVRVEVFQLKSLDSVNGYYKVSDGKVSFKCVSKNDLPLAIKELEGREVTALDRVFWSENGLARAIDGDGLFGELKSLTDSAIAMLSEVSEPEDSRDKVLLKQLVSTQDAISDWLTAHGK